LMVPESACIPIPSEVTLLFAGYAVGQGWMSLPLAVLSATAGNLVGSVLAYGLGASGLLERLPAARRVLSRWEGLLERHGTRAVFLARLLPLARTFVSLPAGARHVGLGRFIALSAAGCAVWAAAFVLVGMSAGAAWTAIDSVLGRALLGLSLGVVLVSIARRPRTAVYVAPMHPTAARLAERLEQRGLQIEVRTLDDSARTAELAAAALGVEVGQIVKSLVFLREEDAVLVLCAGDRRVDAERLGLSPARADRVREVTGFSIGGVPPLGHDVALATTIDESLRRFELVWAAAGTPHDVFAVRTDALIEAIPGAVVTNVA